MEKAKDVVRAIAVMFAVQVAVASQWYLFTEGSGFKRFAEVLLNVSFMITALGGVIVGGAGRLRHRMQEGDGRGEFIGLELFYFGAVTIGIAYLIYAAADA